MSQGMDRWVPPLPNETMSSGGNSAPIMFHGPNPEATNCHQLEFPNDQPHWRVSYHQPVEYLDDLDLYRESDRPGSFMALLNGSCDFDVPFLESHGFSVSQGYSSICRENNCAGMNYAMPASQFVAQNISQLAPESTAQNRGYLPFGIPLISNLNDQKLLAGACNASKEAYQLDEDGFLDLMQLDYKFNLPERMENEASQTPKFFQHASVHSNLGGDKELRLAKNGMQQSNEFRKPGINTSSCKISTPDKISGEEKDRGQVDDISTPQRQKHRPKVLREGKFNKTPPSETTKNHKSSDRRKRKYTRKICSKTSDTQPNRVEEGTGNSSEATAAASCRRELRFQQLKLAEQGELNSNIQVELLHSKTGFNLNLDSQAVCGNYSNVVRAESVSQMGCQNELHPFIHPEETTNNLGHSIPQGTTIYKPQPQRPPHVWTTTFQDLLVGGVNCAQKTESHQIGILNQANWRSSHNLVQRFTKAENNGKHVLHAKNTGKNLVGCGQGMLYRSTQPMMICSDRIQNEGKITKRERCIDEHNHFHYLPPINSSLSSRVVDQLGGHSGRYISQQELQEAGKKQITEHILSMERSDLQIQGFPESTSKDNSTITSENYSRLIASGLLVTTIRDAASPPNTFEITTTLTNGSSNKVHEVGTDSKLQSFRKRGRPRKDYQRDLSDDLTCQMEPLDLDKVRENAIVWSEKAVVPYQGDGPFAVNQAEKRKPRVDLDQETERMWNVLMGQDDTGVEAVDDDKEKYWEEERKGHQDQAFLFINRMHLIQGNRKFSPWKGSVVDSVVGVFLTQGVTDVASSSAFMELAAKFPPCASCEINKLCMTSGGPISKVYNKLSGPDPLTVFESNKPAELYQGSYFKEQPEGHFMGQEIISTQEASKVTMWHSGIDQKLENLTFHSDPTSAVEEVIESILIEQGLRDVANIESKRGRPKTRPRNQPSYKKIDDWDMLRKEAQLHRRRSRNKDSVDSMDYETVRHSEVDEIAETIKQRGMNSMLAERIKDFLNRLVTDHGSVDLEWLRDTPPHSARDYLLSIKGLGLKSVECICLLTLHHPGFPVDTNVARIAVRLGWVPIQPLPESIKFHELEKYPMLDTVQKYLWPRLCKLDQQTLYELHYQMITFGKVFCTMKNPNCHACPMRADCRHFASAFPSSKPALLGPEEMDTVPSRVLVPSDEVPASGTPYQPILEWANELYGVERSADLTCQPTVELPASPEQESEEQEIDIERLYDEDNNELPEIKLNYQTFTQSFRNQMQKNLDVQDGEMSKALVALTAEVASFSPQKLKIARRLRTEHRVYELPDSHPLIHKKDKREQDDPSPYLLVIWTPGETSDSRQPPKSGCQSEVPCMTCTEKTRLSCNCGSEEDNYMVKGTLLIPCRTAMKGSFPLNGTFFQVNEMFADHESSINPIDVPRVWIWNLPRRTVYFGTSVSAIFRGMSTEEIQYCFCRGFICVRGFDQKYRAPRPLLARFHQPATASKLVNKSKNKKGKNTETRE